MARGERILEEPAESSHIWEKVTFSSLRLIIFHAAESAHPKDIGFDPTKHCSTDQVLGLLPKINLSPSLKDYDV
jgi:hypothetical protein